MAPKWLDQSELAERYGVTRQTIYRWRKRGLAPPAHRIGGRYLFKESEVDEWESSAAVKTAATAA